MGGRRRDAPDPALDAAIAASLAPGRLPAAPAYRLPEKATGASCARSGRIHTPSSTAFDTVY